MKPRLHRALAALAPALVASAAGLALIVPPARAVPLASFSFSPASPLTLETVTFSSSSTGVVEPQRWDLDGNGVCDDATGPIAQRSFPTAGRNTVKLCVTDGVDNATLERTVTILNRPPTASFTHAPASPLAGDRVLLTSTSADPDGPLVGLAWDLDNDAAYDDGTAPSASLSLPAAGNYVVRLLALDRDGATSSTSQTISVTERPPEPLSPFPIVRLVGKVTPRGTVVRRLTVVAPEASEIRIGCRNRGCPFRSLTRSASSGVRLRSKASGVVRIRRLRRTLLRPGAVLEVSITKQGQIGKYTRYRIRKRRPPKRIDRCLVPGVAEPTTCPSS